MALDADLYDAQFQSTPSARRATSLYMALLHQRSISIHALREEGDCIMRL